MKSLKLSLATALVVFAAVPAMSGGLAEPMMEPEVIVEESSGSSAGFIVPLFLIALLVAASSSSTPIPD